jgi:hypothetical protein
MRDALRPIQEQTLMQRPPCWPDGVPCPNGCASATFERLIHNNSPLYGPWSGWRMAGRELVSPDGDRINPERLRGLLFVEHNRLRLARLRNRATKHRRDEPNETASEAAARPLDGFVQGPQRVE